MKPETVLANYAPISAPMVGILSASLSPDGWVDSQYRSVSEPHLRSAEVTEFHSLVTGFFNECKTQNDLRKFCRKHGTDTDAVTSSFRFECALMVYLVHVTGYSVTFVAHRKENA